MRAEDVIHHCLKCGRGIRQPKGHNEIFVVSIMCTKNSLKKIDKNVFQYFSVFHMLTSVSISYMVLEPSEISLPKISLLAF